MLHVIWTMLYSLVYHIQYTMFLLYVQYCKYHTVAYTIYLIISGFDIL